MDQVFQQIVRQIVGRSGVNLFDLFVERVKEYHDAPCHSLSEMRERRNTKAKGDLFEVFCKAYLKKIKGFDDVWSLGEIPDEVKHLLGLGGRDVGIDIVARKGEVYSAVQCKFKTPRKGTVPGTRVPYDCVNWKELSTFYALCARTNGGAWGRHVVMTNCRYVRHMGNKNTKDWSLCHGTFKGMTSIDFARLIDAQALPSDAPDLRTLREARLRAFDRPRETS